MTLVVLIIGVALGTILAEAVRRLRALVPMTTARELQIAAHKSHETLKRWLPSDAIIVIFVANRSDSAIVHNAESDGHVAKGLRIAADALELNRFSESRIER